MSKKNTKQKENNFSQLFTPKFFTVLREGYGLNNFKADLFAGLTVAIVALPLSIAIAIASGASPAQGLYTAIIGGFFVSLLGGSRFQIGGPAGAFIVVIAATIAQHGMDGLVLAVLISGLMLLVLGYLRLGTYIKFIPYPVTVGFTAGIAVIIFCSQLINMLGLKLTETEPGPIIEKLTAIYFAFPTLNFQALGLCLVTVVLILGIKKLRPHFPNMLIAVIITSLLSFFMHLDVATVGSQFGAMPSTFPIPSLPNWNFDKIIEVLPAAITFALLGAIESLLSAVVADGMTGRKHRSNCELVGQGFANIMVAFFNGICVTGTIARTATNIRAGAHGPIAGIMHSLFLLLFVLFASSLIAYIPLSVLAGILAVISWNMVEKKAINTLMRASFGDNVVLLSTFLITIFWGLAEAIVIGFALGALLFIHRMSNLSQVIMDVPLVADDKADQTGTHAEPYDEQNLNNEVVVYYISGAFFFGAAASIGSALDSIADPHKVMILDFAQVPFLDSSGAHTIEGLVETAKKRNIRMIISGASIPIRKELLANNIRPPHIKFYSNVKEALKAVEPKRSSSS